MSALVAHGGTGGLVVELAIVLGLFALVGLALLRQRVRDEDETPPDDAA